MFFRRPLRRHYFVYRRLQTDLTLLIVGLAALQYLAFYVFFKLFVVELKAIGIARGEVNAAIDFMQLKTFLLAGVFQIVIMGILALWFSHRIAGPLYKVRKALTVLSKGRLPELVVLRREDYLKDIARLINKISVYITTQRDQLENRLRSQNNGELADYVKLQWDLQRDEEAGHSEK